MKKKILLFLLILGTRIAWAQEPVDLGIVDVVSTRLAQNDYKLAGNVSVITRAQIEASNATNIPDILKQTLGVNVYDNSTSKTAVIDIRGFGDTASRNVLVLVNDRKVNTVDISGPDLLQIPIEAVDRIEVIRGASSVLYGDNAVGGVVNIITKKGKGKVSGRLGGVYGSYDTQGTDMQLSGSRDKLSYYLYSKYLDERGYRSNSDILTKDFNSRVGYDVSDKLSLDLNVGWHRDDYGLPGGLSDVQMTALGRRGSANESDFASTKDRFIQLSTNIKPWPEDLDLGYLALDFNHRNRDVYDAFFSFGEFSTKRNIDTTGITGKYIFNKDIFNREVNFITGVDYYDTENDILGSGSNVDDITISKKEIGLYGFLEYEIGNKLFVNGGTRYQKAKYDFNQRNVVIDQSQSPEESVSMGGFRYEYAKGSTAHINFQQTFRFLATDEWYSTANFPAFGITPGLNLGLKQQTGQQYEAGIKHNFNDIFAASVTGYMLDLKDEIFFDPVTFANSNYDKTRRIGVEVGETINLLQLFPVDFLDKLEFFSNYTYETPKFREGANDGKYIPMVARHEINSGLIAEFLKHYNLSLTAHYVGSRFAINDTDNVTSAIKPYYVVDSKVGYDRENWGAYVAVNNIFDELYSSYVAKSTFGATKSYFPAPERNVNVGVNIKF